MIWYLVHKLLPPVEQKVVNSYLSLNSFYYKSCLELLKTVKDTPVSYQTTVCSPHTQRVMQDAWESQRVGEWVCPRFTIKGFWWLPRGSAISTPRQDLASSPIMIPPPQQRVRWSFLNRDGRREVAGWNGKEKRSRLQAICGNEREFLI